MIPYERISEIASARAMQPAIILNDRSVTWSEFRTETGRYIAVLQTIAKSQRLDSICFVSPNRVELLYLLAAAATLKITAFGLDYTQPEQALRALMLKAGTDAVVISSRALLELGLEPMHLTSGRPSLDIDGLLPHSLHPSAHEPVLDDHITLAPRPFRAVGFTSGTSGDPKVVVREASFDARRFAYFTARYGFSSNDRHLVTIPLYHAAGNGWARLFLNLGATIILPPAGDHGEAARMLVSEAATTSAMTPPIAVGICHAMVARHRSTVPGVLRFVLVGGKNFSTVDKEFCSGVMRSAMHEYYGTTETGVNTIAEPDDIMLRPDSVGKPYDGNEIMVLGRDGTALPAGEVGRIAIHSYMNMTRYVEGDTETVEHDDKTYIVTNETGCIGADGYLRLRNRHATVSTINLYRLEDEIKRLPYIADAAIVPNGETQSSGVTCGYVLREDADETPEAAFGIVTQTLKSTLRKTAIVASIEKIPYSPSGKILASSLKDMVARVKPEPRRVGSLPIIGALLLAGTATAWGGMFHIAKSALTEIDAFHVTLIRYGLAALIFLALLVIKEGLGALRVGRDALRLWVFGTLGFAGFSILAFWGLSATRPEHGAVIMALMPLITVVILFLWKGARVSGFTLGCIVIALIGVLTVISNGSPAAILSGGALVPNLAILLGAGCWVAYTIGARSFPDYSVLRYTAISAGLGAISIIVVTLSATALGYLTTPSMAQLFTFRLELAYLVLIAGVAAVFSWNSGIKLLGPVNGVLFINLVPITALGFGHLRGHSFSEFELIGAAVTIAALLANNINDRHPGRLAHLLGMTPKTQRAGI